MARLPDDVLDACRLDPAAPFAGDPARRFGLHREQALERLARLKPWLREQQTMLWANRRDALLLVLQGPDCAGKNGVIRRVLAGLDPSALKVTGFQPPTSDEQAHGFLWRYRHALPTPGQLGVFNRSYYESLVSDRRDGLCRAEDVPLRLEQVRHFERQLATAAIRPLKCYLQISHVEQKRRLHRRLDAPDKRWKLSPGDLLGHRSFAARQAEWAQVLIESDSHAAPWYVIPADHRWLRDLLVASLLAKAFEQLALDWPRRPAPFGHHDLDAIP
ncbi:hypothetical protein K9B43_07630 [Pseudomonas sp. S5(2021)]|nr:hypothetical protein [Pseudomonas sp. S5(2021)]